jgi:hypothetical protein
MGLSMIAALGLGAGGCRYLLGPDDARPDLSNDGDFIAVDDAAVDGSRDGGGGSDRSGNQVCDLLLQDCPKTQSCHPDDKLQGDTFCLPKGAMGGPQFTCVTQSDCDARLVCITSDPGNPASSVCADLCRPGATTTGCQTGMLCVALANYDVGYCRF